MHTSLLELDGHENKKFLFTPFHNIALIFKKTLFKKQEYFS